MVFTNWSYHPSTLNQHRWSKYGPWRSVTGHFSTLRAWEAARVEYRWWDDPQVREMPKLRKLPEPLEETNYWEGRFSVIKENRWNHTRQMVVETPEKHRKLKDRRKARRARTKQKDEN